MYKCISRYTRRFQLQDIPTYLYKNIHLVDYFSYLTTPVPDLGIKINRPTPLDIKPDLLKYKVYFLFIPCFTGYAITVQS